MFSALRLYRSYASEARSRRYQTELLQLRDGHILRQHESAPQLLVLNHQSEIGVAVVDLRHQLAVADFQEGQQGERGADQLAVVVEGNSIRRAELNVAILHRSRVASLTEINAETRKSTLAVRFEAISQKIGTEAPLGS